MHILFLHFGECKGLNNDVAVLNDYAHALGQMYKFNVTTEIISVDSKTVDYNYDDDDQSLIYYGKFVADIVIHIQDIFKLRNISYEDAINILIPNPEWTNQITSNRVQLIDQIWHKTYYSQAVFENAYRGLTSIEHFYLGFTTMDRKEARVKNFDFIGHFRGGGVARNTDKIVNIWMRRPDFPLLRLKFHSSDPNIYFLQLLDWFSVKNIEFKYGFSSDEEYFFDLTSSSGVHICTSEVEGFGHYINESRMVGAVPIVINGFPMCELVDETSGYLIEPNEIMPMNYGLRYKITEEALENKIEEILKDPMDVLVEKGRKARKKYEDDRITFVRNFHLALQNILIKL